MLYLKYRPQKLEDLDLAAVKQRLILMVKSNNIPHALLFSGPKGSGKTSAARIIAKTLNCNNNAKNNFQPCNQCNNCISITKSENVDVVEMDAASTRKIDDIRDIISTVKYAPLLSKHKFYIIDEVHMLTKEAFNALLKTLEEPPKNTYFILATTEPEQIPKTIRSRCFEVLFTKATFQEIDHMLKRILKSEKIKISDEIVQKIARHADGSFRDATKILDELIINQDLTENGLQKIINLPNNSAVLLKNIDNGDKIKAINFIHQAEIQGNSFKELLKYLLIELQDYLIQKSVNPSASVIKYKFSLIQVATLMKLFQEAYQQQKYTPIDSIPIEIAVIEYFEKNNE